MNFKDVRKTRWLMLSLVFFLFSCNRKYQVKVNVPKNFCGYAFLLIDKNGKNDHVVHLDKDGVAVLHMNEEIDIFGGMFEYEIVCEGKDITEECSDFNNGMTTQWDSTRNDLRKYHYSTFIIPCASLEEVSSYDQIERFNQIRNKPKVKKWFDN